MGPRLSLQDYQRIVTGMRFADAATRRRGQPPERRSTQRRTRSSSASRPAAGGGCSVPSRSAAGTRSPLLGTRDGRRVLTRRRPAPGGARRPDADPGEPTSTSRSPAANAIALGPDDRTVAVGGSDGSVRFVDLRTGARARSVGTPRRGRDRDAVHAGRPRSRHDERRRRRDPVGRARRRRIRDVAGARQRDRGVAGHTRQPDALHGRARRRDLRVGPRRHAAARPARSRPAAPTGPPR